MKDIILDTFIDSIKLVPFLFVAFLIIELIEHKLTDKSTKIIKNSNKFGPVIGSLLGAVPQCGFSVVATNLYVTRIITLGTLISIYLSTSDEMLPILISHNTPISTILKILGIKVLVGMLFGFIIDLVYRNRKDTLFSMCEEEHCECKKSIIKSGAIHTLKTSAFIMVITLILNIILYYFNEELISKIFMQGSFFAPFIASLIGLIPNCASSVAITELYLNNIITLGTTLAGLLTNSGLSLIVLFRANKNIKENLSILLIIYLIGVLVGIVINFLGFI